MDAMLFPRRPQGLAAYVAIFTLPLAVGLAWIGCATASDDPGATPVGGGKKDSGASEVQVDEDGNPIFDADDAAPEDMGLQCPGVAAPNSCATAIEIATLAVGGKTVVSGAIEAKGERWYKVAFTGIDDKTAHPHVKLSSTDPGVVIELVKSCGGENLSCGSEDAAAKDLVDFEMSYVTDPDADPAGPDPSKDGDPDASGDTNVPITVGEMGVTYMRVYRKGEATSCDYKIDVSN
jgi:hypothetical protein